MELGLELPPHGGTLIAGAQVRARGGRSRIPGLVVRARVRRPVIATPDLPEALAGEEAVFQAGAHHVLEVSVVELLDGDGPHECPARILFVRTPEAKARLLPALSAGNVDKTKAAPVTAIIGYDTRFYELLPRSSRTGRR